MASFEARLNIISQILTLQNEKPNKKNTFVTITNDRVVQLVRFYKIR